MTIDADLSGAAMCDEHGVPSEGRRREFEALRRAGYRNLAAGRIFEGHVNALQLIGRCGTPVQRARAAADARAGHVFGVWNTADADGVFIEERGGGRYALRGAKTWCSGAGTILRPIVTAQRADGASQMCIVPMERAGATVDAGAWQPLGMHASESFRVIFDGVELDAGDVLGRPGEYERAPWFLGGAIRFVAVQTGGIERLVDETTRYLLENGRDGDTVQTLRVAEMHVALRAALNWLDLGADAWRAFDREPSERSAEHAVTVTDMARAAVERHALDVMERTQRCVGARGLLEPLPFAALCRDLQMYLRQPAPDAALLRVGRAAFSDAIAQRSASSAESTATGG